MNTRAAYVLVIAVAAPHVRGANEDVFASSAQGCDTLHAVCVAKQNVEAMPEGRLKSAADGCAADLDRADGFERQANATQDELEAAVGKARPPILARLNDEVQQRGEALRDYQSCLAQGMRDLRPADYPKSDVLLSGGVSTTEVTPDEAAQQADLAATLQQLNDALDPISTPLQKLSQMLGAIAPHYDMASRNDTGIRLVGDVLIEMGAGHLIGKIPAALRAMKGTKAADEVVEVADEVVEAADEVVKGTKAVAPAQSPTARPVAQPAGKAPSFGNRPTPPAGEPPVSPAPVSPPGAGGWALPEGVPLPPMLANTPRNLHLQEMPESCVLACVKMVGETVMRKSWPENVLRHLARPSYRPSFDTVVPELVGTQGDAIADLLSLNGVRNTGFDHATVDQVFEGVKDGYPAIVSYGRGHVAVADLAFEHAGEKYIALRDPANPAHLPADIAEMMQNLNFSNQPVMKLKDFEGSFTANKGQGWAAFTNPR